MRMVFATYIMLYHSDGSKVIVTDIDSGLTMQVHAAIMVYTWIAILRDGGTILVTAIARHS